MNSILQTPYHYSFYLYGKIRTTLSYYFPSYLQPNISEIYPNIFVGNLSSIIDKETLHQKKITHILSAVSGVFPVYPTEFTYMNLDLLDEPTFNIKPFFNESNNFFEKASNSNNKILVHCICGVSRSVTLACAYLIYKYHMSPTQALEHIQNKRPIANPNPGFMEQLKQFYIETN